MRKSWFLLFILIGLVLVGAVAFNMASCARVAEETTTTTTTSTTSSSSASTASTTTSTTTSTVTTTTTMTTTTTPSSYTVTGVVDKGICTEEQIYIVLSGVPIPPDAQSENCEVGSWGGEDSYTFDLSTTEAGEYYIIVTSPPGGSPSFVGGVGITSGDGWGSQATTITLSSSTPEVDLTDSPIELYPFVNP